MEKPDYLTMEPNMLYSLVNMKLRNEFADLNDLAKSLNLDAAALERRLGEAGYVYDSQLRQFRPGGATGET